MDNDLNTEFLEHIHILLKALKEVTLLYKNMDNIQQESLRICHNIKSSCLLVNMQPLCKLFHIIETNLVKLQSANIKSLPLVFVLYIQKILLLSEEFLAKEITTIPEDIYLFDISEYL